MKISDKLMKQYRENLDYLIQIKRTIGNINNRIHSSAIQLVELYLLDKFPEIENLESKGGSESGIDIVGKKDEKPIGLYHRDHCLGTGAHTDSVCRRA